VCVSLTNKRLLIAIRRLNQLKWHNKTTWHAAWPQQYIVRYLQVLTRIKHRQLILNYFSHLGCSSIAITELHYCLVYCGKNAAGVVAFTALKNTSNSRFFLTCNDCSLRQSGTTKLACFFTYLLLRMAFKQCSQDGAA